MFMIGAMFVGASIALLVAGTSRARASAASHRDAVQYLEIAPVAGAPARRDATRTLAGIARRFTPKGYADALRAKLVRAHDAHGVERFLARKALLAIGGTLLGLWTMSSKPSLGFFTLAICAPMGFVYPDVRLRRTISEREEKMRAALPESLDLMAITVEAGVGLEGALARAAEDIGGPLGEEYAQVLREMQLGASRREALHALKDRVDVAELSAFVLALLQADSLGIAVGRVLKTQAGEMRSKRRMRARERAAKTPVKILFPLVFGIFPALLIVVLGPAIIKIMGTVLGA
jgi:tight adherence protein C